MATSKSICGCNKQNNFRNKIRSFLRRQQNNRLHKTFLTSHYLITYLALALIPISSSVPVSYEGPHVYPSGKIKGILSYTDENGIVYPNDQLQQLRQYLPWLSENEDSFQPSRFLKINYLDQIQKRNDDKRQLKIIRLKKDSNDSPIRGTDELSGVLSDNNVEMMSDNKNELNGESNSRMNRSPKQQMDDNVNIQSDGSHIFSAQAGNRHYLDDVNPPIMSKRALKILRLKKNDALYNGSMMPKLNTLNPIYLRHFNTNKRALKIIRLKKNDNAGNTNVDKYLNFMNPSKQFWNRFGRNGQGLYGRSLREEGDLGTQKVSALSPDDAMNLYSRFY